MGVAYTEDILARLQCNKCSSKGLSLRETAYGIFKEVRCKNCLHTWVFDGLEKQENIIKEIQNTKPPGYH